MIYVVQSLERGDCPGWAPPAKPGNYKIVTKDFIAKNFYTVLDVPFSCDMLLGFPRLLPARVQPLPPLVAVGQNNGQTQYNQNPLPICPRGYSLKKNPYENCVLDQRVQDAQMRILQRKLKDIQAKYPPLPGKPQSFLPRTPILAETYTKARLSSAISRGANGETTYFYVDPKTGRSACPAGSKEMPYTPAKGEPQLSWACYVDCLQGEIDTGMQCIKGCPTGYYDLDPKTATCYAPCPNGTVTVGNSCRLMDYAPTFDIKSTDKVIIKKEVAPIVSPPDAPFVMDGYLPWNPKYDSQNGGGRQPRADIRCPPPAQILTESGVKDYKCYPQCKEGETTLYDGAPMANPKGQSYTIHSINTIKYHLTCRKCPDGAYNVKGDGSKCFPKCPKGQLDLGSICVIKGGNAAGEKYTGVPDFLRPSNLLGAKVSKFTDYVEDTETSSISNKAVCDWFYVFFIFNAIFVAAVVVILFTEMKGGLGARILQVLPTAIVGVINLLFWYLMCDRTLLQ
jgi:hypothetical protein